jgi:signal transduction histidine kinase
MRKQRLGLNFGQVILVVIATTLLASLSISSFTSSNRALNLATQANSASNQSTAIIITQRETLVFAVHLAEWVHGGITRRDLQINRALLAQRLEVIDSTGVSIGKRARPSYLIALKEADALIASGTPGILPINLQPDFQKKAEPIIDAIVSEGHLMIDDYSRTVGLQIKGFAESQKSATSRNLYLLGFLILVLAVLISWVIISWRARWKRDRLLSKVEEQRLQEVREELGEAQETVRALTHLNEAKNEFVSTINHELRTPLTSIIGYVELLKDYSASQDDEEFHAHLNVLSRNANVLLELIESILLLSSLDADEVLEVTQCDIAEICKDAIAVLQLKIDTEKIAVDVHQNEGDEYLVEGNRSQLSQVFTNLISNAIKFSPKDSRVTVTLERITDSFGNPHVKIAIKDQGMGIPASDIPKLFARFYRASNATNSQIPGSGLGLAIVSKIVSLHRGEIWVESQVGVGTTMFVELPVALSEVEKMVLAKREGVLKRSILALEESPLDRLKEVAHEVGGAIGFYTFLDESKEVLDFSRWLKSNPGLSEEIIMSRRDDLLKTLNDALFRIVVDVEI